MYQKQKIEKDQETDLFFNSKKYRLDQNFIKWNNKWNISNDRLYLQ